MDIIAVIGYLYLPEDYIAKLLHMRCGAMPSFPRVCSSDLQSGLKMSCL